MAFSAVYQSHKKIISEGKSIRKRKHRNGFHNPLVPFAERRDIVMKCIAIVTGVASGMGKYIAQELAKRGIKVFGVDIKKVTIDKVECYVCDVSNEKQVVSFIKQIENLSGRVDYLINVAGVLCYKERNYIEILATEEWKKVFEINVDSVFYMIKYTIPLLKKSDSASIVNFSTDQVKKVKAKSAPYAVTKAAVEMLTKIVALELIKDHIRVNAIEFASVDTNFIKNYVANDLRMEEMIKETDNHMPYGIIKVEDAWQMVEYLIRKDNKMTGQILLIDSGTTLM